MNSQYNGARESKAYKRTVEPVPVIRTCRATQEAVSTSVFHVHRCGKQAPHRLAHVCAACDYRWNTEGQSD